MALMLPEVMIEGIAVMKVQMLQQEYMPVDQDVATDGLTGTSESRHETFEKLVACGC